MVKKIICILLSLSLITPFTLSKAAHAETVSCPKADGTFIQEYLMKDWTDAQWKSELTYLKNEGMHYIVLGSVADADDTNPTIMTTYPTNIPGCQMKPGYHDIVDICLRNAKAVGMKVFLGTNSRNDWFQHMAKDRTWFLERMKESNLIADELWTKYKSKYPETFCGWYWCYELDNANYSTTERQDTVADGLNVILDHLSATGEKMPFMFCPFMNDSASTPESYENMWKYIFSKAHFTEGDIFAPQDGVGSGGTDNNDVAVWFKALKAAVDTKPGLKMWSDAETFDHHTWDPALLNRFTDQLKLEAPYVENFITFAYSHYYSPNAVDMGYQTTYNDYLKNGVVESVPPQIGNIYAESLPTGPVKVTWDAGTDNIGICGYDLYRNGTLVYHEQLGRNDYKKAHHSLTLNYNDFDASPSTKYTYTLKAFDFAGNYSSPVSVTLTSCALNILPNNISEGCSYTVTPNAHSDYPDTSGKELTDGVYGNSKNYNDPCWQGWYGSHTEAVIDLGKVSSVQQFIGDFLYDSSVGIYMPSEMKVSVSSDGVNYTDVGNIDMPTQLEQKNYTMGLTLNTPVQARYVKLTTSHNGDIWVFIDEFKVLNNERDLPNLISKNCSYTVSPSAYSGYPDTNNTELTDGNFAASTNYNDAAWQGFDAGTGIRTVTLDLGSINSIGQVTGDFLYNPSNYMYTPSTAEVYISSDGINYTKAGDLELPKVLNTYPAKCKMRLTLSSPVSGRYVKLNLGGGAWVFVDEIEVRNN